MNNFIFVPLEYQELDEEEMLARSSEFLERMEQRRSVRQFSSRSVPWEIIENCLRAAATAPSGANMQPWHYVVVSDSELKHRIRMAAEEEEREFYANRAPQEWLDALEPLGTDADKPFLESAPYLIVIFAKSYTISPQGKKVKNYYVSESVGIATGILITALHQSGLATLTHTPSPMRFLNQILNRPQNEHPFLILVVGYPAEDAEVPKINKKPFNEINTLI
jgi:iodotyrosine deiodinase